MNLRYFLLSPQSVYLASDTITEEYFFQKKSFKANGIESISINHRFLNFGRGPRAHSFVDIATKSGYTISIEYFHSKTPDIYEILQGWHKKHTSKIRQTIGPD
jgi:hypothetical protein